MGEAVSAASTGGSRTIEVEGAFSQAAAQRVRQLLLEDRSSRGLTLDFSRATRLDEGLPLLAVCLIVLHRNGRRVGLRGLPAAARASLLHFGISASPEGQLAFFVREELPFTD